MINFGFNKIWIKNSDSKFLHILFEGYNTDNVIFFDGYFFRIKDKEEFNLTEYKTFQYDNSLNKEKAIVEIRQIALIFYIKLNNDDFFRISFLGDFSSNQIIELYHSPSKENSSINIDIKSYYDLVDNYSKGDCVDILKDEKNSD